MKIEPSEVPGRAGRGWFAVRVEPDELMVASGKRVPYGTWLGTIGPRGQINVWSPAASKPRGYREAAKKMLAQARAELCQGGKLGAKACARP